MKRRHTNHHLCFSSRYKKMTPNVDVYSSHPTSNKSNSVFREDSYNYQSSPLAEGMHMMIEDQDLVDEMKSSDALLDYDYDANYNYKNPKYIPLENYNTNDKFSQPSDCHFNPMATVIDEQYWSANDNSRPRCFSAMEHASFPLQYTPQSTVAYRTKNLTYVVVDVHTNMQMSTEELCCHNSPNRTSFVNDDVTEDFQTTLQRDILFNMFKKTDLNKKVNRTIDSLSLSPRKTAKTSKISPGKMVKKKRPRTDNSNFNRSYRTVPRMLRLSSGGSGDYAIPYDAII